MTAAAAVLRNRLGGLAPRVAVVLGSSLDAVAGAIEQPVRIAYRDLPGFPVPSVSGHAGALVAGRLGGRDVAVLQGRVHPYETGRADAMRPALETLAALGIDTLVLTNAAGSLDPEVGPGRIMLITDHINFSGMSPLAGEPGDRGFLPMADAYDRTLAERMRKAAAGEGIDLASGVYIWFAGPNFETPAEIRAARALGADAAGMSTVPETILARRFGMRVAALSVITNYAAGMRGGAPDHENTKAEGARAAPVVARLLRRFIEDGAHD